MTLSRASCCGVSAAGRHVATAWLTSYLQLDHHHQHHHYDYQQQQLEAHYIRQLDGAPYIAKVQRSRRLSAITFHQEIRPILLQRK